MTLSVSIVIPTYNRAALLPRALQSALCMTLPGDEVIVVDDASTDNTAEVAAAWGDRIRYVRLPHGGAAATRNAGIRLATRPLIAFLDSDDEWCPHKLALQRALMAARPEILYCFSDFRVCYESGGEVPRYLNLWHSAPICWETVLGPGVPFSSIADLPLGAVDFPVHMGSLYLAQMEGEYVLTSALMVRREAAGATLQFDEQIETFEDLACFAQLSQAGPAAYLDCELVRQWAHDRGRVSDDGGAFRHAGARLVILDRIWGRDPEFLARYGARYLRRRTALHLLRSRWYLRRGRTREARQELAQAASSPWSYRLLATLPSTVTWGLLSLRGAWRRQDGAERLTTRS